jgi:dipeptidyl aminopeptidase/acylaminoacyl peptidase
MSFPRIFVFLSLLAIAAGPKPKADDETDPFKPAAITTSEVPVVPKDLIKRLQQYQNVRSAGFEGWSPDGKGILIQTRFANTAQLHRVLTPLGYRQQVTYYDEPAGGRFIPKDKSGNLLVTMSAGGSERNQIYHFDRATGKTTLLTDGKSRNLLGPVLRDGSRMIVASNQRNGRDTDLYIADTRKPGTMKMILETKREFWYPVDWSPDRFTLLINRYVSINETYPALLDIVTGKKTTIPIPGGKTAAYGAMAFAADGKSIYVASDAASNFRQLARVDLKTFEYTWITKNIPWDVTAIEVDPNSGMVAFTVNENGSSALYFLGDVKPDDSKSLFPRGDAYVLQPNRPVRYNTPLGVISSAKFSPDGKHVGFTLARADAPADVFSVDMETGKATQWTNSEVGGLDPSKFIRPTQVFYPTFDRITVPVPDPEDPTKTKTERRPRQIPAYYFKPRNASKKNPVPVVIIIHGGPESQYRPRFSSLDQFLLNELGVAVIRPNVRGSAGYGKEYLKLDNAERREESVRDIGKLLDWIKATKTVEVEIKESGKEKGKEKGKANGNDEGKKKPKTKKVQERVNPELDPDRVAVMGGSYGGYMVLASLMHYSDRLKAGVDIVGIASFATFLKNTSAYRRDLRRAEYGDERDPKMKAEFARIDPLNNAGRIRAALFVAHGQNDPRVPFSEAVQIVEKVRKNGKKVWTVYAANEGHGFRKKENSDYLTAAMVLFLRQHLK